MNRGFYMWGKLPLALPRYEWKHYRGYSVDMHEATAGNNYLLRIEDSRSERLIWILDENNQPVGPGRDLPKTWDIEAIKMKLQIMFEKDFPNE